MSPHGRNGNSTKSHLFSRSSAGLLVYPGTATVDGFLGDHIQVAPPLVVTREEIDEIVAILDASIGEAEGEIL